MHPPLLQPCWTPVQKGSTACWEQSLVYTASWSMCGHWLEQQGSTPRPEGASSQIVCGTRLEFIALSTDRLSDGSVARQDQNGNKVWSRKPCTCSDKREIGKVWRAFHYLLSETGTNELRNCIKRKEWVRRWGYPQSCVLPMLLGIGQSLYLILYATFEAWRLTYHFWFSSLCLTQQIWVSFKEVWSAASCNLGVLWYVYYLRIGKELVKMEKFEVTGFFFYCHGTPPFQGLRIVNIIYINKPSSIYHRLSCICGVATSNRTDFQTLVCLFQTSAFTNLNPAILKL